MNAPLWSKSKYRRRDFARAAKANPNFIMIVLCLEGTHGSGKSSIISEFARQGFQVLDEGFLDMPDYALHPQSLLMETSWVCSWFERILKLESAAKKQRSLEPEVEDYAKEILIADRSPYSAVFYANHGHLLEPLIRQQMEEVRTLTDIEIYTIHVAVEPELLWSRIQGRLKNEPHRAELKEHQREWMDQTLEFYYNFEWDTTIENNAEGVSDAMIELISVISERSVAFKDTYQTRSASICSSIDTVNSSSDGDYDYGNNTSYDVSCSDLSEQLESISFIDSIPQTFEA